MFIFRGIGRLILDSKTVPIKDKAFTNLFTSYINIPGLDVISTKAHPVDNPHIWSPLLIGALVVVVILLMTARSRHNKKAHGYHQNSALIDFGKAGVVGALIMWYCYLLSQYKGISVMLVWVLAICLIYYFITSKTSFGRYFYAVGGNEKATRLSGVNTKKVYFIAYANMGLLAGLAGILTVARASSAQPTYGQGYEMDAIASCFIGGASAYGGVGKITGVIIGAALMGIINQGMSIMGISTNYQRAVKGIVLLVAVLVDVLSKKEKA